MSATMNAAAPKRSSAAPTSGREREDGIIKVLSTTRSLHLSQPAIHEQFDAGDVAAVAGCQENYRLRDLVWRAEPADRDHGRQDLQALSARFGGRDQFGESWRVDRTRADCVHTNAAMLQLRRPRARERAHRSLGGAVHAVRRKAFAGDNRGVEDDR